MKSSIWPIDEMKTSLTNPYQSGPGTNDSEGSLHIPKSFRTAASQSDAGHIFLYSNFIWYTIYIPYIIPWNLKKINVNYIQEPYTHKCTNFGPLDPSHWRASLSRPKKQLCMDTRCSSEELLEAMKEVRIFILSRYYIIKTYIIRYFL